MTTSSPSISSATVADVMEKAVTDLQQAGVENVEFEVRELMAHILQCPPMNLLSSPQTLISFDDQKKIKGMIKERCRRVPLAYLLEEWDFWGLRLRTVPGVLIPRSETEELVEIILQTYRNDALSAPQNIVDVGTGSGCIAIALAHFLKRTCVTAVDISPAAVAIAKENISHHNLSDRVQLRQGDLLSPLLQKKTIGIDAVVANLPYVEEPILDSLQTEVHFEPRLALNGGHDGLDLVRRLLPQAFQLLNSGGHIFLELGKNQSPQVVLFMEQFGFGEMEIKKDFAGIPRFVMGRKP